MNDEDLQLIPYTRTEDLLAWADGQGLEPVPEDVLRTVLTLLELGGAPLHDGFPELGSAVLEQLLHERLHLYVQPVGDPAAYGAAVRLLIDRQRWARRLNAKRQERLHAEAEWQGELLTTLLRRPQLLTWPRLYTLLLEAHGVHTGDWDAVRAWLDAFRELSPEERVAAYAALVDGGELDAVAGPDAELLWSRAHLLSIGMATDGARRLLEHGLMRRSYRNLAALTAMGEPMPEELAGGFEEFEAVAEDAALWLCGQWTVPGLPELLVAEYPDLAPEPGTEELRAYAEDRALAEGRPLPDGWAPAGQQVDGPEAG
ncbi:hypothetical protein [Kitasatospora sp. NPDC059571]|uniref:hypothetical protein n=1 Tax=Kitasatospora sp. NPDC059571 TaxID=3346871 RepID=UPI0036859821